MPTPPEKDPSPYRTYGIVSMIATDMAVTVVGGLYVGKWLDSLWGTSPWLMLTGIILGLVAGIMGIIEITKRFS